ncbi:MAG TPA: hypothetical protein VFP10_03530 [Candidatus Eisenbacteria bacterium]|nr:hypothetical protein [Candidatus Eisenbacteria bacterium]
MDALYVSLALLALSLLSGLVAAWEKLGAPEPRRRALGLAALLLLAVSLMTQAALEVFESQERESVDTFLESQEKTVEEASGAAFLKDRLFVVDDEKSELFEYRYDEELGEAEFKKKYEILPGPTMRSLIPPETTVGEVDDLEAVATYKKKLYVVSSHSPDKKNQRNKTRELILEIGAPDSALPGDPVAHVERAATLAPRVEEELDKLTKLGARMTGEELNIEGLAIDPDGTVYIGLRSPLMEVNDQLYAILLQTDVESVFSGKPINRAIGLRLEKGNDNYGITSLDFDGETLLILGNGPGKRDFFQPKIWQWRPSPGDLDQPPRADWNLRMPEQFDAKPEALALSRSGEQAFIFVDAPGHGGQRVVSRQDLGLREAATPQRAAKLAEKRP